VTTEDAISVLDEAEIREQTLQSILKRLDVQIRERVHHSIKIGAILFSNQYGYLGETEGAAEMRQKLQEQAIADGNRIHSPKAD
jgi:cobalt-precorrin-5B (C1)-methyltransferase